MAIRVSVNENDFIEVVVEDFAEFVQSWAPHLSSSGIFVPTHQILLTGETYSVEVQLLDGFPLIQARGEVVWTRDSSAADLGPSGAAIRLDEVDSAGRDLIARIEDRYVISGGERFDIEASQRRRSEAVLIPEPDAQLLKEATLGSLRDSSSERRDGVMSISAGNSSPNFAPGMGSANDMKGGTMAPIQSGVWRALSLEDVKAEGEQPQPTAPPPAAPPDPGRGLEPADQPQAALDALEPVVEEEPVAAPPVARVSPEPVDAESDVVDEISERVDDWFDGLGFEDSDWEFYETDESGERRAEAADSADRGAPPPAATPTPRELEPPSPVSSLPGLGATRPPADEIPASKRAFEHLDVAPTADLEDRTPPAPPSLESAAPAPRQPPRGEPAAAPVPAPEEAPVPAASEPSPLHDVAAMRDAAPDSDSPPWSEPLEAPPSAPRRHSYFEVDDLFRIDDEADLEEELRASAMQVSRTISALGPGARSVAPEPVEESPGEESPGEESPGEESPSEEIAEGSAESAAGAAAGASGEAAENDADAVVFEQDLELALADLNAPEPPSANHADDAEAVVFEQDLERAMSELTGSHQRIDAVPAAMELDFDTEPAPPAESPRERSPRPRPTTEVRPPDEISASELFPPSPQKVDPPKTQRAAASAEDSASTVRIRPAAQAPTGAPAPAARSTEVKAPLEPAPPLEALREASAGTSSIASPSSPVAPPASSPKSERSAGRSEVEAPLQGPASGLSSIDEALADPVTAVAAPQPAATPPASEIEPMAAERAFENVSSDFLRTSLRGAVEEASEASPAVAQEPGRDPMRELAESVGGKAWAPWESEPEERSRPKLRWPDLSEVSGPLRAIGILILAPLFVLLYLGVQRCYGGAARDSAEAPALGPPGRMTLTDGRIILETPGRSLWDLYQDEDPLPEVELLVTTPVAQAARRLVSFRAEAVEGGTEVTLEGDGAFGPVSTVVLRLDQGTPREALKISGIVEPPGGSELEVATAEVERLRFGYHLRRQYNELQVVADLTSPDVQLVKVTIEGQSLVLRFERRGEGEPARR